MNKFGRVFVEADVNAEKFAALIGALNLKAPVLIKPNWGTVECYTEADILDWTLAAIPGEKIVIESHGWARNEETLHGQPSGGLTKANLRKGNHWFLEQSGIQKVLDKHNVEFLNLTEEIWAGRAADAGAVQQAVEARFAPVQFAEHYSKVPARLYDLRGGTLLSLAKLKLVFQPLAISMAVKNQFGLIPGPSRGKYHGKNHVYLDQNIVDINKIYQSLFKTAGIIEIVHSAGLLDTEEERTRLVPGSGFAFASEDLVALDACATAAAGRDPLTVSHLRLAAQTFGAWDEQACAEAAQSGLKVLGEPALV
jgi:uncharacterized protein (DUF362 family)